MGRRTLQDQRWQSALKRGRCAALELPAAGVYGGTASRRLIFCGRWCRGRGAALAVVVVVGPAGAFTWPCARAPPW